MTVKMNIRKKYYTTIYNTKIFDPEIIYNYGKEKTKI